MRMTNIYTLAEPNTGEIRYVGKADSLAKRMRTHFRREKTHKSRWVQSLVTAGKSPVIEVLDTVPESEWQFWEQHWIQVMRGWGFRLTNGDNGGLGGHRYTPELRKKISDSLIGTCNLSTLRRVAAYTKSGEFVFEAESIAVAAQHIGVGRANITRALAKQGTCAGLQWRYVAKDAPLVDAAIKIAEAVRKPNPMARVDVRARIAKANMGRVTSQETREKQRAARLGKSPSNKGIQCPASVKATLRDAATCSRKVLSVGLNGFIVSEWMSVKHASEALGVARAGIAKTIIGRSKHAGGKIWFDLNGVGK